MHNKFEYYVFDDNFDKKYSHFRSFLDDYTPRKYSVPYVNKTDPDFWLKTRDYIVMVPINKLKKYDSSKPENVKVQPYTSEKDI